MNRKLIIQPGFMKSSIRTMALVAIFTAAFAPSSFAQLNIPSDGSDGALIIASNTVIDLSRAVTGAWDASNTNSAGKGIYDSNNWAVVFKYSSVAISNGATVTFANHPSRAPVVWLVNGDVMINGTVSLDGAEAYYNAPRLAEPGPGGFRGGAGYYAPGVGYGSGFGPGGGSGGNYGVGGSYGSVIYGPATYGNPSLLPLIGGSGGGGYFNDTRGGGGGAGAILIACNSALSISGTIHANGGRQYGGGGGGSGGGVRLVAGSLAGNGIVQCLGGVADSGGSYYGGLGRIRIERVSNSASIQITPDPSVVPLQAGATPLIWLPGDGPTARIVSIGNTNAPADPRASFGTFGADVTLPQVSTTPVVVETTNAEAASIVTVRVSPRANGNYTETTATLTQTNSTNPLVLRWLANVPVNAGYSAVQVKVVRP